jgi:hypothetical protein
MSNITTVNNIICSGNQTISGNIISSGNLQTTAITSTSISNSNTITSNSINATTGSLTNTTISNILTLLSNTPITFNYNGTQYNISALMLFTLNQLGGSNIASQNYVNQQISNLVNSSPDLLNTLSGLAAAINNDASFSTTMTNLIATKSNLSGNNSFTGSKTFSNIPYFVNTSDQLINKAYVDGRFTTLLSANNTFSGSNTFSNDTTGNIINRDDLQMIYLKLLQAQLQIIYIIIIALHLVLSTLLIQIFLEALINSTGALTIPSITTATAAITTLTSTTGSITNLYSNILSINNGTVLRSANDIFNVSINSSGNYLYYNNTSVFGHINTSNSALSWSTNSSGNASFPSLTSVVSSISSLAVNSSSVRGSGDLIAVSVTPTGNTTGTPANFPWTIDMTGLGTFRSISNVLTITNLYSNVLTVNNNVLRATNDIFEVATSSTSNYLYYNNSSVFGHINVTNSNNSWYIDSNALAKITKLSVNSTLRSSNDLFNDSASSA